MAHGGYRPGAGRKPGSINRASMEARERAAAGGVTPLDYMLAVLRDEKADTQRRDDMAKAAAPYIHARLQAVQHTGADGGPIKTEEVSKLEIARRVAFLLASGAEVAKA